MKRFVALCALPLLAGPLLAAPLRILPPGRLEQEKGPKLETIAPNRLPTALAHGSRATGGTPAPFTVRAVVTPAPSRLGQRLTYRAWVLGGDGARVSFATPKSGGAFTWGAARRGREVLKASPSSAFYQPESAWIEVPLQIFATGPVAIPGPMVTIVLDPGNGRAIQGRAPTVRMLVLPTIAASDTNATLRPVHGPLGAPWWERVPWALVVLVIVVLAALAALIAWVYRQQPKPVPLPAPTVPRAPVLDAATEALRALAKLREQRYPEQGRVREHAFELTSILKRYLERTTGAPRPGDTSSELLARLRVLQSPAVDLTRLEGLFRLWDRVKFARAPLEVAEAQRCEAAVEQLVRAGRPREVA